MSDRAAIQRAWLAQVQEEIVDPERRIVDPHHHLWRERELPAYLLEDLWADTGSGHRIEKTVFVECGAEYLTEGPESRRPLGEIDFVADIAEESALGGPGRARIAGLVSHADLTLGDAVEELLIEQEERARGLFRGVRHAGARDEHPDVLLIPGRAPEGLYADPDFRRGLETLGRLGHTYDTWHYHHQNPAFTELARAVPDTLLILDHFGTPLGVGPYADRREEIFQQWQQDVAEIARCENVVAKLGGLAMPDNGFGWFGRDRPATSDELVAAQSRYYLHMIECFGTDRCMFESNFPVDKLSISYPVLWNGLKKMVADFSADEKDALFRGTAERVYRL
jgi:predicted TIM-barrel fold metal-dependent hydrolase